MKSVDILRRIAESARNMYKHFYIEEGITLGYERSSNQPFKLKLNDFHLICITCKAKMTNHIIDTILNDLNNKEILLINWTNSKIYPLNAIEGNKIFKFQVEELNNFFSFYNNLYDFMVYFSELLGDLFNLNYDEKLILKRILIDRIVPQMKEKITFKDIFKELKEAQFRSQYENEYRYSMTKKLDDLINDKLLEEISINTTNKNINISIYELNVGLVSNFRLKILLLNLIFNSLHYRVISGYRPILFLELPSSILNYLYRMSNIQIWDQIYNTIRLLPNIFLITDNLTNLPKELINIMDFVIVDKENTMNEIEFVSEEKRKKIKHNITDKDLIVIEKDGNFFELEVSEEDNYIIID